jgi:hypothetical protein
MLITNKILTMTLFQTKPNSRRKTLTISILPYRQEFHGSTSAKEKKIKRSPNSASDITQANPFVQYARQSTNTYRTKRYKSFNRK